jgi:predicted PurR-regulated permease PerM
VTSVVPPVLRTLLSGQPFDAVWVVLSYMAIQALEGTLIVALVMSRAVSLHPVAVIFARLVMGTHFGLVRLLLLAVPLAVALHVLLRELWVERMDGVGTDPDPVRPRRELPSRGRS